MLERFDDPHSDEAGGVLKGWDTAQICRNGHAINECAESQPASNSKFCQRCGAPTITTCPKCQAKIRGYFHVPGVFSLSKYSVPPYCHGCGSGYPWTAAR